jgi:hypothetical protein
LIWIAPVPAMGAKLVHEPPVLYWMYPPDSWKEIEPVLLLEERLNNCPAPAPPPSRSVRSSKRSSASGLHCRAARRGGGLAFAALRDLRFTHLRNQERTMREFLGGIGQPSSVLDARPDHRNGRRARRPGARAL